MPFWERLISSLARKWTKMRGRSRQNSSEPTRQPTLSLISLPDVTLLTIFANLPPEQLLSISQIYSSWLPIERAACTSRRTLILSFGDVPPNHLAKHEKDSILYYPAIDLKTVHHLARTFPNIAHLTIYLAYSFSIISQAKRILTLWSGCLLSLTLYCYPMDYMKWPIGRTDHLDFTSLLVSLNLMPTLRHLKIDTDCHLLPTNRQSSLQLSVFSQLSSLYLKSNNLANVFLPSLLKYGQANAQFETIFLWGFSYNEELHQQLPQFTAEFLGKFTSLPVYLESSVNSRTALSLIGSRFSNLTELNCGNWSTPCTLIELSRCLAPLKSLLMLSYSFPRANSPLRSVEGEGEAAHREIHPLTSITTLAIYFRPHLLSHEELQYSHWALVFPSLLKFATLAFYRPRACSACGYTDYSSLWSWQKLRCDRAWLKSFRGCTQLTTVCLQDKVDPTSKFTLNRFYTVDAEKNLILKVKTKNG